jgi:hypothetical protein
MDLNTLRDWESSGPVPFNVEDFGYDQMTADDGTSGSPRAGGQKEEEAAGRVFPTPQGAPLAKPGDPRASYSTDRVPLPLQEGATLQSDGFMGEAKEAASMPRYQGPMDVQQLRRVLASRPTDKVVQQAEGGVSVDARRSSGQESEKTMPPSESLHMGGPGYSLAPMASFGRGYIPGE